MNYKTAISIWHCRKTSNSVLRWLKTTYKVITQALTQTHTCTLTLMKFCLRCFHQSPIRNDIVKNVISKKSGQKENLYITFITTTPLPITFYWFLTYYPFQSSQTRHLFEWSLSYLSVFLLATQQLRQYPNSRSKLTHIRPIFHFCSSWKRQETRGFLMVSGGVEMEHWHGTG